MKPVNKPSEPISGPTEPIHVPPPSQSSPAMRGERERERERDVVGREDEEVSGLEFGSVIYSFQQPSSYGLLLGLIY